LCVELPGIIPVVLIVVIVGVVQGIPVDVLTEKLQSQSFFVIVLGGLGSTIYDTVGEFM
jgi:hypothetical protein